MALTKKCSRFGFWAGTWSFVPPDRVRRYLPVAFLCILSTTYRPDQKFFNSHMDGGYTNDNSTKLCLIIDQTERKSLTVFLRSQSTVLSYGIRIESDSLMSYIDFFMNLSFLFFFNVKVQNSFLTRTMRE